jgi:hypothetical protein
MHVLQERRRVSSLFLSPQIDAQELSERDDDAPNGQVLFWS